MATAIGGEFGPPKIDCDKIEDSIYYYLTHHKTVSFYDSGTEAIYNSLDRNSNELCYLPEYLCMEILNAFKGKKIAFYRNDKKLKPIFPEIKNSTIFIIDYFGVNSVNNADIDALQSDGNKIILDITHSILNKERIDITKRKNLIKICSLSKIFQTPKSGIAYDGNLSNRYHSSILELVSIDNIIKRRQNNLNHLYKLLSGEKSIEMLYDLDEMRSPFTLPILFKNQSKRDKMRKTLIDNMIYPPIHWINSHEISKKILSIPIDQRYNKDDMGRIYEIFCKNI